MSDLLQQIKASADDLIDWKTQEIVKAVPLSDLEKILEGMAIIDVTKLQRTNQWTPCGVAERKVGGWYYAVEDVDALIALPQPTLAPDGDGGVE